MTTRARSRPINKPSSAAENLPGTTALAMPMYDPSPASTCADQIADGILGVLVGAEQLSGDHESDDTQNGTATAELYFWARVESEAAA